MEEQIKPLAWISRESLCRLEVGGNDSRGTVPVHFNRSRTASTAVYRQETVHQLQQRSGRLLAGLKSAVEIINQHWLAEKKEVAKLEAIIEESENLTVENTNG